VTYDSPHARFHGRIPNAAPLCAQAGCEAAGEFRAPAETPRNGYDGPPRYRFLCLDHIREFNARYDYFAGMDRDAIEAAQRPYGGWERETRAFSMGGADRPPPWADFHDPLDAISARFKERLKERSDGKPLSAEDRVALKTLGLEPDANRRALRVAYTKLARQYHPDHNGGDRSAETKLQKVIAAYAHLRDSPLFAT
jgi:hypothetical protein